MKVPLQLKYCIRVWENRHWFCVFLIGSRAFIMPLACLCRIYKRKTQRAFKLMSFYGKRTAEGWVEAGFRPALPPMINSSSRGQLMMTAGTNDLMIDGKQRQARSHPCILNSHPKGRRDLLFFFPFSAVVPSVKWKLCSKIQLSITPPLLSSSETCFPQITQNARS